MNRDDFVEMMLLDGCFIIEFLRKYYRGAESGNGDPLLSWNGDPLFTIWSQEILRRDLLQFENQLPFFVLLKLFEMTKIPGHEKDLIHLAISCLNHCIAPHYKPPEYAYTKIDSKDVSHLLGLMYDCWCSFLGATDTKDQYRSPNRNRYGFPVFPVGCNVGQEEDPMDRELEFIKSVVELQKDGIEFKKAETSKSWLDIRFNINSGIIEIPSFLVHHSTEAVLRNLIAYEEYMFDLGRSGKFVTDYATFMDCLINTSKDVTMLRHEGIIKNWLGDDEAVAKTFNKIRNNVFLFPPVFTYREIFKKVNKHCSRKRHRYIANLKKKYFSNPWSVISLLAATVLLLLTLTQTIFAALQLWK